MIGAPDHAERLDLFENVSRHREPSKYAPGAMASRLCLTCPGCKTDLGLIRFVETIKCDCGLSLHADGCDLRIWRDLPVAAE